MSTYDYIIKRLRSELPMRWRVWLDESYPCHCDEAWTGRDMHTDDCQWAVAVGVVWDAQDDGMLMTDAASHADNTPPADVCDCGGAGCRHCGYEYQTTPPAERGFDE